MTQPALFRRFPPKYPDRIQLYSLATPNGVKASIALEELDLPYEAHSIDIRSGAQFTSEFMDLNPNSKIPAIWDPNGPDGKPIGLMESGAILVYLADKAGRLIPNDPAGRSECLQWLFFQAAHIGPTFGQFGHFYKAAADACDHPYPLERFGKESRRLLDLLETRLTGREYLLGEAYTIADIAVFPWVRGLDHFYQAREHLNLDRCVEIDRWLATCLAHPAVARGLEVCPLG